MRAVHGGTEAVGGTPGGVGVGVRHIRPVARPCEAGVTGRESAGGAPRSSKVRTVADALPAVVKTSIVRSMTSLFR
jgi:hypothetical protein